jgi:LmbE family N-acetylglucosaminyl deacetylase
VEIFAGKQSVRKTVELMRRFAPDVVITHSPTDYMLDHEETARIVRAAVFAAAMPLYKTRIAPPAERVSATPALYYADPVGGTDPMGRRIPPQFYIDITGQIEDKRRLLSHHSSQREWLRSHHGVDEYLERMSSWAASYGRECGTDYAEGLRQHRGHGYPREPHIQQALKDLVRKPGRRKQPTTNQ